jgi:hypothetical protein
MRPLAPHLMLKQVVVDAQDDVAKHLMRAVVVEVLWVGVVWCGE